MIATEFGVQNSPNAGNNGLWFVSHRVCLVLLVTTVLREIRSVVYVFMFS